MITETTDKNELLTAIDEPVTEMLGLMMSLDENKVNTTPYKDSWTAGQLLRHVIKSTVAVTQAMQAAGKPAERNAAQNIPQLKKTFLDFTSKLQSPDFIVPEAGPYEKRAIGKEFSQSFEQLKESANRANLDEVIEKSPLGPVTKLEMLHFVLYHTRRHLHQMHKICATLKSR